MNFYPMFIVLFLFIFLLLGYFFPLRNSKDQFSRRLLQNFSMSILGLALTKALILFLYPKAESFGYKLPFLIPFFLLILVFDYLLYWWHRLNHRVHFLWRFHLVHHTDLDMDTSTALRFHYGELLFSVLIKSAFIFFLGISIQFILLFDFLVTSFALFHHSNILLPENVEKYLRKVIVTPTFHQNHHSHYQNETDSNFSTIFSFWDHLHGTHTKEMPTVIGLPAYREKFTLFDLIFLPSKKLRLWPSELKSRTK